MKPYDITIIADDGENKVVMTTKSAGGIEISPIFEDETSIDDIMLPPRPARLIKLSLDIINPIRDENGNYCTVKDTNSGLTHL